MQQLSFSTRLILAALFLIVMVIVTAIIDLRVHFPSPFIVIGIMLVACFGAARIISNFNS